eukprot:NODE_485_length_6930_cov_0.490411.p2 type:complete len:413 gc:universal NODE_485_length_6930_cov_0.490411:5048-3810(-)
MNTANLTAILVLNDMGITYGISGISQQHGYYLFEQKNYTIDEYVSILKEIFNLKLLFRPKNLILAEDIFNTWTRKKIFLQSLLLLKIEKIDVIFNCNGPFAMLRQKSGTLIKFNNNEIYSLPIVFAYPDFQALSYFDLGMNHFTDKLKTLILKEGHLLRLDVLAGEAKQFLNPKKGLVEVSDGLPVKTIQWNEDSQNRLSFSYLRRIISHCFVGDEPNNSEISLKEVTKSFGAFKTIYQEPIYKSSLDWAVIPLNINSKYGIAIPGWIVERLYEDLFEGNRDNITLADIILQSFEKMSPDHRIVCAQNCMIQFPFGIPIYGLQSRLTKSIFKRLPKYPTLLNLKAHFCIKILKNEEGITLDSYLDSKISKMCLPSHTLEFAGLSLICSNPSFKARKSIFSENDLITECWIEE